MRPKPSASLTEVAVRVGDALRRHSIRAVLTGGACACVHTDGAYSSVDVDFVLQSSPDQAALDRALASLGFHREDDRYVHDTVPFFVEFPPGPLGIGADLDVRPIRVRRGSASTLALSPTDSCRDRLAAFYHWSDRQSLEVAVGIALRKRVNMRAVREWSQREDSSDGFAEFEAEIARAKRRKPRR